MKLKHLILMVALFLVPKLAQATLSCPHPNSARPTGLAYCSDISHFDSTGTLCIVEPVSEDTANPENIGDNHVCALGKIDPAKLSNLIRFSISYDYQQNTPIEGMLNDLNGVFNPDIDTLTANNGEFMAILPLAKDGPYNISFDLWILTDSGVQQIAAPPALIRPVLQVSSPNYTVTSARIKGRTGDNLGVKPLAGDKDGDGICDGAMAIPGVCSAGPDPVDNSAGNPPPQEVSVSTPGDKDGDGICDDAAAISGVCSAGPDTTDDSATNPPPHTVVFSAIDADKSIQLCISGADNSGGALSGAVAIQAIDTVVDSSVAPSKTTVLTSGCGAGSCSQAAVDDTFCPGGFIFSTKVANGRNDITLTVGNLAAEQTISVNPFDVNLVAPILCVNYLDANGNPIVGVDNGTLLTNEAVLDSHGKPGVLLDVTACTGSNLLAAGVPECNPTVATACGNSPLCVKKQNSSNFMGQDNYFSLCQKMIGGAVHYQVFFENLRYPVNTFTLKGTDVFGNQAVATHSFAFGEVRPVFDSHGNPSHEMTPQAAAGFISKDFIKGDLIAAITKAVNTEEFKKNIFFKLLDPIKPTNDAEAACIQHPDPNDSSTVRVFKIYDGSQLKALQIPDSLKNSIVIPQDIEDVKIGDISIPSLYFLNGDQLQLQILINGISAYGEVFTMKFSDQVDNHGIPSMVDYPGILQPDPTFGISVIPIHLKIRQLAVNLQVTLRKDGQGNIHFDIGSAPQRMMVEAYGNGHKQHLADIDCSRAYAVTAGDYKDENGRTQYGQPAIDQDICENQIVPANDQTDNTGLTPTSLNTNVDQQILKTMENLFGCLLPTHADTMMQEFNNKKITSVAMTVLDKNFDLNFDLFAPPSSAELHIDATGVSFAGNGLVLPAGVTPVNNGSAVDADSFLKSLPNSLKNSKFGPVYPADDQPTDPMIAAMEMGNPLNLALKEEAINSFVHSASLLLWDLGNKEGSEHQFLDLSIKRLRELGMAIPNIGDSTCYYDDGSTHSESENFWKCFSYPLTIENALGSNVLPYVDFNGNGITGTSIGEAADINTPVLIRTAINPASPPTMHIVSMTPLVSGGSGEPDGVMAEVEIGLRNMPMSIYEEDTVRNGDSIQGTGEIRSFCDDPHVAPTGRPLCTSQDLKMPIVTFSTSGRIFLTVYLSTKDKGMIHAEGGISSVEIGSTAGSEMGVDTSKTDLKFTVIQNNTVIPDKDLAEAIHNKVKLILGKYVFGNTRDVKIDIPLHVDDPKTVAAGDVSTLQDFWNGLDLSQYNVLGMTLEQPRFGVTGSDLGPTRYLTTGAELSFQTK